MQSWMRKMRVSRAAGAAATAAVRPVLAAPHFAAAPVLACEALENRRLMSASADLTNAYAGLVNVKANGVKVKETINIVLTAQSTSGYVTGQISSVHGGTVDVKGMADGKNLKLVGSTSGRLIVAKVGKNGLSLTGSLVNGVDDSVGKFKVKKAGDAPESLPAAGRAAGAVAPSKVTVQSTAAGRAIEAAAADDGGALDPGIDPTTGLPIDPATGQPIDPAVVPPDVTPIEPELPTDFPDGGTPVANPVSPPAAPPTVPPTTGGAAIPPTAVGDRIGNNFSILGVYTGTFNNDGTGQIEDILTGDTTGGLNPRTAVFTTATQDDSGLITGTLAIGGFATFNYSGFINGTDIQLVLSGPGSGLVSLTLNDTGDAFSGVVTAAESAGDRATGPIDAAFTSGGTNPGGGGGNTTLPDGEELYHVDVADANGEATTGNLDPNNASIGTDFSVGRVPLVINSLGAFDSGADGLVGPIRVAIYNTASPGTPVVVANVTTDNSGLAANSGFRYLTDFTPVTLTNGIYRIVAFGFDQQDLAGDIGVDTYVGPVPTANTGSTGDEIVYPVSDGIGSNNFFSQPAGGGAGGGGTLTYPTQAAGLPQNRYLAGSFLFEEGTVVDPSDPTGGGTVPLPPPPPPPPAAVVRPAGSAYPGGVYTDVTGPEVFGSQSTGIIPG